MNGINEDRRRFLKGVGAYGVAHMAGGYLWPFPVFAETPPPGFQGIWSLEGDVTVNGISASPGMKVRPGDTVKTGDPASGVVFALGEDAFMLRDRSELTLAPSRRQDRVSILRLARGKLMSVFGRRGLFSRARIETPTAIAGIRGTGIYVETDPEKTYMCTCYGKTRLQSRISPDVETKISSDHHCCPHYFYPDGSKVLMEKVDIMDNHGDDELVMLEALVGRRPPFLESGRK